MRVIIDTNIFIYREDHSIVREDLQNLLSTLQKANVRILIHPLSISEIEKDRDLKRREIVLSKIKTYPSLDNPPTFENDEEYLSIIGITMNQHDITDNHLLYCINRNAADFLITEDQEINKKSEKLGISQRVFNIEEAQEYFNKQFLDIKITSPPAIEYIPVHNLDVNDPFFDSLKKDYSPGFEKWWGKISRDGRKAWTYFKEDRKLGAILICKDENEDIASIPPLPVKERIKICTLKVSHTGHKIGELFIKMAIQFAVKKNIFELYLTHFTKENDSLINLIEEFGFYKKAMKGNEDIYVKELITNDAQKSPIEIAKRFYPSFYDGKNVNKFIIPIQPTYYERLFSDPKQQLSLAECSGGFVVERNTIKKAYLCHSKIKKMSPGDVIIFYKSRSRDSGLMNVGVVEKVYDNVNNPDEIAGYVGKRTVYSRMEIEEIAQKPTKVIIFKWHFNLKNPLKRKYLLDTKILSAAPQSIVNISHEKYLKIKKGGEIDQRFTVD